MGRVDGEEFHEVLLTLGQVNYGTCDYLKFNKEGTEAVLVDLKFGFVECPNAKTNLQLLNYAAAAFFTFPKLKRIFGAIFMVRRRYRYFAVSIIGGFTQSIAARSSMWSRMPSVQRKILARGFHPQLGNLPVLRTY